MLVRINTLAISALPSSRSSRPGASSRPSLRSTEGRATSASTSITVWSSSAAMLIARLIAVKLLPSPGNALVSMIRLPCSMAAVPLAMALAIKGRLITRYWSARCERGEFGTTKRAAISRSRSSSTIFDTVGAVVARARAAPPVGAGLPSGDSAGTATASNTALAWATRARSAPAGSTRSGISMPAWRICARRSAACSIKLLIGQPPPSGPRNSFGERQCRSSAQPSCRAARIDTVIIAIMNKPTKPPEPAMNLNRLICSLRRSSSLTIIDTVPSTGKPVRAPNELPSL